MNQVQVHIKESARFAFKSAKRAHGLTKDRGTLQLIESVMSPGSGTRKARSTNSPD